MYTIINIFITTNYCPDNFFNSVIFFPCYITVYIDGFWFYHSCQLILLLIFVVMNYIYIVHPICVLMIFFFFALFCNFYITATFSRIMFFLVCVVFT